MYGFSHVIINVNRDHSHEQLRAVMQALRERKEGVKMIYRTLLTWHRTIFCLYTEKVLKGNFLLSYSFTRKWRLQCDLKERTGIFKAKHKARHRIIKPETSNKHCQPWASFKHLIAGSTLGLIMLENEAPCLQLWQCSRRSPQQRGCPATQVPHISWWIHHAAAIDYWNRKSLPMQGTDWNL